MAITETTTGAVPMDVTKKESLAVGDAAVTVSSPAAPELLPVCSAGDGTWAVRIADSIPELYRSFDLSSVAATPGGLVLSGGNTDGDALLLWLDSSGNLTSQRAVDLGSAEAAYAVSALEGGGLVVAGEQRNDDGDAAWVLRLDGSGSPEWARTYREGEEGSALGVRQLAGGEVVVFGGIGLAGLDQMGGVSWHRPDPCCVSYNALEAVADGAVLAAHMDLALLVWLDADGQLVQAFTYGSWTPNALTATTDGGVVVAGNNEDGAVVVRLGPSGVPAWQTELRVSDAMLTGAMLTAVAETPDGGFLAAGGISPSSGDPLGWVVWLDSDGEVAWQRTLDTGDELNPYFGGVLAMARVGDGVVLLTRRSEVIALGREGDGCALGDSTSAAVSSSPPEQVPIDVSELMNIPSQPPPLGEPSLESGMTSAAPASICGG